MIVKLSLGDIERARLVLQGGSVLDWHRFEVTTAEECDAILRANGFHPENEEDAAHLRYIRMSAVDYIMRNFEISFAPEILNAVPVWKGTPSGRADGLPGVHRTGNLPYP